MKREKAEILFDAITAVREDLIEAAQNYVFHKKPSAWRRYAALAACLVVVAGLGFGALRLGLLDGMGGSGSNTTGAADGAAPESSGETTSDTAGGDDTGDTGDTGATGAAETTFGATVLEVHDGWLLVEPLEGEDILASADRFMVSLAGVEEIPDLEAGVEVAVTFDGMIRESYPAQITATGIELLSGEGALS